MKQKNQENSFSKEQAEADAAAAELKKAEEEHSAANAAHSKEAAEAEAARKVMQAAKKALKDATAAAKSDPSKKPAEKAAEKAFKAAEAAWKKEADEAAQAAATKADAEEELADAAEDHRREAEEAAAARIKADAAKASAEKEQQEANDALAAAMDAAAKKQEAEAAHKKEQEEAEAAKQAMLNHEKEIQKNKAKRDAERAAEEDEEEEEDGFGVLPDKAALAEQKAKAAQAEMERKQKALADKPPPSGCWKIVKKARSGSMWTRKQDRWLVVALGTLYYYEMKDADDNNPPWYRKGDAQPKNDMRDGIADCTATKWHESNEDGTESAKSPSGPKRRASAIGGDDSLTIEIKSKVDDSLTCQFSNAIEVEKFLKCFNAQSKYYSANRHKIGKDPNM